MRVFTDRDLLVPLDAPRSERRAWNKKEAAQLDNVYIGQLKLLAGEIEFLTLGVTSLDNCVVVYAGAAAGHHIPVLADLYKGLHFYLYDPAPFAIEETERIHIINGFFTDDVAREWGSREDIAVIFICDIRTSGPTAEEHESEVQSNMDMQARWVELMKPALRAYSLKFRIPFTIVEADQPFEYLGGKLVYQVFAPIASMELRLLGNAEDADKRVTYDSRALEQTVYYHNSVVRPNKNLWANVFTETDTPYMDPQFDNGYDCTVLLYCVKRYVALRGMKGNREALVLAMVRRMIQVTSQGKWTFAERKAVRKIKQDRPRRM